MTIVGLEMAGGNFMSQKFLVKFNVENPNNRSLPVTGLHAELNVAGERVASGTSNRSFVVPAHGESEFDMTITANLALALLKLSQRDTDSIEYDMTGAASIDLPFMRDLPFHQSGSFSLRGGSGSR